jgi:enoyl-CoA hydratase/carnithine racemase
LIHRVVSAETLSDAVLECAELIAANAPLTIAAAKKCIREATKDPGQRDVTGCETAVDACFDSADYIEGRTAFMEKRCPVFRGR